MQIKSLRLLYVYTAITKFLEVLYVINPWNTYCVFLTRGYYLLKSLSRESYEIYSWPLVAKCRSFKYREPSHFSRNLEKMGDKFTAIYEIKKLNCMSTISRLWIPIMGKLINWYIYNFLTTRFNIILLSQVVCSLYTLLSFLMRTSCTGNIDTHLDLFTVLTFGTQFSQWSCSLIFLSSQLFSLKHLQSYFIVLHIITYL